MAQTNFDWILGAFAPVVEADEISWTAGAFSVTLTYQLVSSADLEAKEDSLRVERVVGDSWIGLHDLTSVSTPTGNLGLCEVTERIYVSEADETGLNSVHNLFSGTDFDRDFLWERRRIQPSLNLNREQHSDVGGQGSTSAGWWGITSTAAISISMGANGKAHPWFGLETRSMTAIDCRVKRRLRNRDVLCYTVGVIPCTPGIEAPALPESWRLRVSPRLRVGVKF